MWKGGMKFGRKRTWYRARPLTKEEIHRYFGKRVYLSDPQSLMNKAVTFCIGKLKLGYTREEAQLELYKLIKKLRETGYCQQKIDRMALKAMNKYRFGFETPRFLRFPKGMLKGDAW